MSIESIITVVSGVVETGAISFLVYMIIKGLKARVKGLEDVITTQKETIETMNKRIFETEKISDLYKKMIEDFPKALDDYRAVITKTKDETIYELNKVVEGNKGTIENLKGREAGTAEKNSPDLARIGKFLINPANKTAVDFFQKFYENADSLYTSVTKHKTLEEFIKSAGYELVQIKNEETNEHMFSAFTKFRPRTQFSSVHGLYYMITFENKVYLNESTLQYLKDKYTLVHT